MVAGRRFCARQPVPAIRRASSSGLVTGEQGAAQQRAQRGRGWAAASQVGDACGGVGLLCSEAAVLDRQVGCVAGGEDVASASRTRHRSSTGMNRSAPPHDPELWARDRRQGHDPVRLQVDAAGFEVQLLRPVDAGLGSGVQDDVRLAQEGLDSDADLVAECVQRPGCEVTTPTCPRPVGTCLAVSSASSYSGSGHDGRSARSGPGCARVQLFDDSSMGLAGRAIGEDRDIRVRLAFPRAQREEQRVVMQPLASGGVHGACGRSTDATLSADPMWCLASSTMGLMGYGLPRPGRTAPDPSSRGRSDLRRAHQLDSVPCQPAQAQQRPPRRRRRPRISRQKRVHVEHRSPANRLTSNLGSSAATTTSAHDERERCELAQPHPLENIPIEITPTAGPKVAATPGLCPGRPGWPRAERTS